MGQRNHHHYIAKGLLRGFARDERVIFYIDKVELTGRCIGIRDAFVVSGDSFFTDGDGERNDTLESEWAGLESAGLPIVRRLARGEPLESGDARRLSEVACMHFARSRSVMHLSEGFDQQILSQRAPELEDDGEASTAFERSYGRPPQPGEITELFEELIERERTTGRSRVGTMIRTHNRAGDILDGMHVQLIRPESDDIGFSIGDSPFLTINRERDDVGVLERVAIGDSDLIIMPMARDLAVAFTTSDEQDVTAERRLVESVNRYTWRAAVRFVACHPRDLLEGVIPNFGSWVAEAKAIDLAGT